MNKNLPLNKDIRELIHQRTSRRNYTPECLSSEKRIILEKFFTSAVSKVPFNSKITFQILDFPEFQKGEKKKLGTYGLIKGAKSYICGTIPNNYTAWIDYGYALEKVILKATDLNLGTCWLGGTFSRSEFSKRLQISESDIIPAITPIGEMEQRTVKENFIRFYIKAKKRKPWNELFFRDDFSHPLSPNKYPKYEEAFEWVRLAPSAGNKQPWRLLSTEEGKTIHFFVERKNTIASKSYWKMQTLDIGIAMLHFEHGCMDHGIQGKWKIIEPEMKMNFPESYKYICSWIIAK